MLDVESRSTPLTLFERETLIVDVLHELFGLGPLEALLADPGISDILVNRHDQVYVEREGRLEETPVVFKDDRHLLRIQVVVRHILEHVLPVAVVVVGSRAAAVGDERNRVGPLEDNPPSRVVEDLTGNRVNYGINTIGGVRRDITPEESERILKIVDVLEERTKYYITIATEESTLIARFSGVGKLSHEDALKYGAVGPVARAAEIDDDIRKTEPYAAYAEIPFKLITDTHADVFGRTAVRIQEMLESTNIILFCIKNLPGGDITVKVPRRIPAGEVISRTEAPRGEDIHYIRSNGTDMPDRIRVRAPTEVNWHGMRHMLEGGYLADVPITIAAIDPCYSCTDRAIVLNSEGGTEVTDWQKLRQYSIDWYKNRGIDIASVKMPERKTIIKM
jgi:hypothetical protein